jgi:hypothetical protein
MGYHLYMAESILKGLMTPPRIHFKKGSDTRENREIDKIDKIEKIEKSRKE